MQACPQIPGWDHQSACGPTRGRAFQSCNSTWQRCHNTENKIIALRYQNRRIRA